MQKQISKTDAKKQIDVFFQNIKHKTSDDVKKIKKLAMSHKIKLGDKRKLFCKKCLHPLANSGIKIGDGFITSTCEKCGHKNRWKLGKEIDFGFHEHYGDGCC